MRYRPFGTSGAAVSNLTLCLGGDALARGPSALKELIFTALEAGVNSYHLENADPALAEIVGENAAEQMVRYWGGQNLYVPTLKQVMSDWIADEIRAGFDVLTARGYSSRDAVFELGLKYGCSGRWVEKILGRPDTVTAADAHQGRLF